MGDRLISLNAAIAAVHKNYDTILDFRSDGETVANSIEDILSELPSATDTNVGGTDTISRSAAVETMRKAKDKSEAHRMLVQLPSAQQIPWDANTRNSMVFTLRTVLNGGDMDAIDEDNIKRLSRWLEGGEP